jgi:hypothetical protein
MLITRYIDEYILNFNVTKVRVSIGVKYNYVKSEESIDFSSRDTNGAEAFVS